MNLYRYYPRASWADSLKELGWLRGHLMKRFLMKSFAMTIGERRHAATACLSGVKRRVRVAAVVLPMVLIAQAAAAADTARPARLHRITAVQSAGPAEPHGKVQPVKPAGKTAAASKTAAGSKPKGHAPAAKVAPNVVAPKDSRKTDTPPAKPQSRRKQREPEPVSAPATMYQTKSQPAVRKAGKQQTAAEPPAAVPARVAVAPAPTAAAAKKILTVDDFVRAAGGKVSQPENNTQPADTNAAPTKTSETHAPAEPFAHGESHPDPTEQLTVSAPPVVAPRARQATVAKPAPIVRASVAHQAPVEASVGVSYDDAPQVADLPQVAMQRSVAEAMDDSTSPHETARETADDAIKPVVAVYSRSGKLIVPPPLKGTHEILIHQNQMADDAGLSRIQDDEDLDRMRAAHLLVSFPEMAGLEVNEELPVNRRYARPWTVKFVADTARAFYARFHEPLHLNSAVRTVEYQQRLQRINGNAAAIDGDAASPHLTGQAIDFGKHGMSVAEIAWMRAYLLPLMQAGKVDVEEEFQQACFHISVYGSYLPRKRAATEVAQLRVGASSRE